MRKVAIIIFISALLWAFYWRLNTPGYLTFSDGAKIADIARNLVSGYGYGSSFSSFGADKDILQHTRQFPFPAFGRQPMMSVVLAVFFKLFGVSDLTTVLTSGFFYLLLVMTTYLLGKRLFGELVGFLAALAASVNPNFLDYATSGASETLFTFEVVLAALLLSFNTKKSIIWGFIVLLVSYFTRPQAFIFIWGFIFFILLLRIRPLAKALKLMLVITLLGALLDYLVLSKFTGKTFLYSVLSKGADISVLYSSSVPATAGLRSAVNAGNIISSQGVVLFKKVFYNLYNFYRLLPQIASPYMWGLFVIGLFKWGKDRVVNSLQFATILLVVGLFLVMAVTIPFFRYVHPVVPFVYLFAISTLVFIVERLIINIWKLKIGNRKFQLQRKKAMVLASILLVLFFVVGQTLGIIFLDSRFKAKITNRGKPPVYTVLSWVLRENTSPDDVIITNLDTWGSWYGERRTIWFPLKPDQLIPKDEGQITFDAIYLTSYLIDDENYYLGDEWRQIFYDPENIENKFISENFELKGEYKITSEENYEKQDARAVLLVRKGE